MQFFQKQTMKKMLALVTETIYKTSLKHQSILCEIAEFIIILSNCQMPNTRRDITAVV